MMCQSYMLRRHASILMANALICSKLHPMSQSNFVAVISCVTANACDITQLIWSCLEQGHVTTYIPSLRVHCIRICTVANFECQCSTLQISKICEYQAQSSKKNSSATDLPKFYYPTKGCLFPYGRPCLPKFNSTKISPICHFNTYKFEDYL